MPLRVRVGLRSMTLIAVCLLLGCSETGDPPVEPSAPEPTTGAVADAAPSEAVGAVAPAVEPDGTDAATEVAAPPAEGEALEDAEGTETGSTDAVVAEEPKKVLILGSSLAATGFGAILERRLDAHPSVRCYRKGKSSSGLSRPDFFDWPDQGFRQVEFREPDIVVVILGGNDGQDLHPKNSGKRVPWHSSEWDAGYKQRMNEFLAKLAGPERKVLWLGLPRTRTVKFEAKMELIRAVQREAVEDHGEGYRYLDTTPLISNEDGTIMERVGTGRSEDKLHADDGIHFTMTGATYLADRVYLEVLNDLGIEPVDD